MLTSSRLPDKVLWHVIVPEQVFAELKFTHFLNLT